mmetsp:Transcript_47344/g.71664  ORF Transcript_47344/g.71664 Transcript_47344/m.71664 type:complete len:104 (+) Transcript_47344:1159-1470(+)
MIFYYFCTQEFPWLHEVVRLFGMPPGKRRSNRIKNDHESQFNNSHKTKILGMITTPRLCPFRLAMLCEDTHMLNNFSDDSIHCLEISPRFHEPRVCDFCSCHN